MRLTLFSCLLFLAFGAFSQTLKTDNLDLNPGGVIYDVVFDEYSNAFIVVGDFTSVQGVPRQNLAMIDATTFTVQTETPITSIDGAIRSVKLKREFLFPSPNRNYLFLGGEFTTVNGQTKNYLCQFQKQEPVSPPFNSSYNLTLMWDAGIFNSFNPAHHVNDIAFHNDSIIAVGRFEVYSGLTPYPLNYDFGGIISCQANSSSFNLNPTFKTFAETNLTAEHFDIAFMDNQFLLAGSIGFQRFDINGVYINDFANCSTGSSYVLDVHETDQDTLLLTRVKYATGEGISVYELNGNMLNCPFNNQIPPIFMDGALPADGFIETYNNRVYVAETNQILSYNRNGTTQLQPNNAISANNNWYSYVGSGWRPAKMKIAKDKLFVFGDNLTTLAGSAHSGLAAMCLPPKDTESFTTYDTLVCEEQQSIFTIPTAEFATGYRWSYSGTGAQFRVTGTGTSFQALNSNHVDNTNANSIEIYFPSGATSGILTVEPYSTCNSATDYQLSAGKTLNIDIVPLPDISMADSTFFNCYSDSAWIVVNSSTAGISSHIYRGIDTTWNDSLLIDLALLATTTNGFYYGVVTEPINQCQSIDSSWFAVDTVKPDLSNSIVLNPAAFSCNTTSMEVLADAPGNNIYWEYDGNTAIPLPNPFSVYSTDSLNFTAYAQQISNGCTNDFSIAIPTDVVTAPGSISGYGSITIPLDSLSCNNPALSLTCEATNGTANWLINGTPTGSPVLNLTEADTAGMSGNIKVFTFQTTHGTSGCTQDFDVVIQFDFEPPFVADYSGNPSINCSQSTVEIVHQTAGNPIEGWLDEFGTQTGNDTLFAAASGDYYYQATGTNGCLNTDTVTVLQTQEMIVNLPSDTLICPGESVSIQANPIINTGETPTFSWSDGSTINSGSATGGQDSELSVIVQTNSGCIGYDTTDILITPPIIAFFSASSGCTSAAIQVDSISGGSGNYEYSLDQINWQISPAFGNVNIGSVDIYIRDDLGCIYSFNETVNPSNSGLAVNFLVPTYNALGDTTVAVSFESFSGFDSLNWIVPSSADIVFESDSLIAFSINSEGWYDISLVGFDDTCQYLTTQSVYFGVKPDFDSTANDWGIQTISVQPNPTSGAFTLTAELGKEQNYTILLTSISGQAIPAMTVNNSGNQINESFQFPVGTAPGSYVLHFVSDFDAHQLTIILN